MSALDWMSIGWIGIALLVVYIFVMVSDWAFHQGDDE